jgi:hypothetical protein
MLESDAVGQEVPQRDAAASDQAPAAAEEVQKPEPNAKPAGNEVSRQTPVVDVASVQQQPVSDTESVGSSQPVQETADSPLPNSVDVPPFTRQPLAADPPDADSSVPAQSQIAIEDQPAETPDADVPDFSEEVAAEIVQVEPKVMTQNPIPPVQVDRPGEPAELAIDTTTRMPKQTTAVADQPEPERVTSVLQTPPEGVDIEPDAGQQQMAASVPEPPFEIVSRIPVPTSKSLLTSPQDRDHADGASELGDGPSVADSVLEVNDLDEEYQQLVAEAEAWLKVAEAMAPQAKGYDSLGPLPAGKVGLAKTAPEPSNSPLTKPADPAERETYPVPVNRIALPEPVPAQTTGESHPAPVRRIQLSELPIRIRR